MGTSPYASVIDAAQRAETPFVLFPADLAVRLRVEPELARQAVLDGHLGPWLLVQGEPVITRDSFQRHLRQRMAQVHPADRELLPARGDVLLGPGARVEERDG